MPPVLLRWLENHLLTLTKGRCFFPVFKTEPLSVGFLSLHSEESLLTDPFVRVSLAKKTHISFALVSLQALHIYWPIFLEHLQAEPLLLTKVKSPACHSPHTNPSVLLQPETDRLVSLRPLWPAPVMETRERDTLEIMTQLKAKVELSLSSNATETSLRIRPCISFV